MAESVECCRHSLLVYCLHLHEVVHTPQQLVSVYLYQLLHDARDVHGNGIPNGNAGIPWEREAHGNGNKTQNREWKWEGMRNRLSSVGMGITCTSVGIYSQRFYAAMNALHKMYHLPDSEV